MSKILELGCQGYMGLKYHMEEALIEKNLVPDTATHCPPVAIFSRKYYNHINELDKTKKYDFCFIGSINSFYSRREWVLEFVKNNFTNNSIYINTDNDINCSLLGSYDLSNKNLGFNPKIQPNNQSKEVQYRIVKENIFYFQTMCASKFVLCPGGDAPWSFRFYETLMCKSIPVVECWHNTYRTKEEADIEYKYILKDEINNEIPYDEYVQMNTNIFEKYHLLN